MQSQARSLPLDAQLLEDVIAGVSTVFFHGLGLRVNCVAHQLGSGRLREADISGIVALSGAHVIGHVVMAFSKAAIFSILNRVHARDFSVIDSNVKDCASEMTNMVCGQIHALLSGRGYDLQMTLPSMAVGAQVAVLSAERTRSLTVTFEFEKHRFQVLVAVTDS